MNEKLAALLVIVLALASAGIIPFLTVMQPWRALKIKRGQFMRLNSESGTMTYVLHCRGLKVKYCFVHKDFYGNNYLGSGLHSCGRIMFASIHRKLDHNPLLDNKSTLN